MNTRKRIAVLVGQAEENYQQLFIEGFLKQAFEFNYDVCVFAMYQKYQETTAREVGESTIFSLINYDKFDAFVVLLDTLQTPLVAKSIEDSIKENFSGPVLCIDKESKYFSTIMTDHYTPVKKLISHLIEHHGYQDIAYLTGKKWHIHSKERLKAYEDCMREHNLPVKENRIFYGDFWYSSGETMVEKLLKDREHMPRAIACANDCMAIGVAKALEANGFHIPENVAVIGYDSTEEGKMSPIPITSTPIPAKACGKHTAICVNAIFEGRPMPEFEAEVDLFIGSTCGCHNESMVPKLQLRQQWETDISVTGFYSCFNHMMEDLLSKSDFKDVMNTIFSYVYQIREFESFDLCLNSQWGDSSTLVSKDANWDGYTERMLHILHCGRKGTGKDRLAFDSYFSRNELLPDLEEDRDVPRAFFFTPMHFEERCLGYAVISYGNEIRTYDDTYRLWLRSAMQGLECFRRIEELQVSNQLLQSSQIRDSLTGLYNYQGLLQQAEGYFKNNATRYVSAIAIDIKGLSAINEQYGRENGNLAIQTVAEELKKSVETGLVCRLGNGEFVGVIVSGRADKEGIFDIRDHIVEHLGAVHDLTFDLAVYSGCDVREVSTKEEFERTINMAVSQKNGNKISERKMLNSEVLSDEEKKEAAVVQDILNENRFYYHFQPIVSAKTGDIFSYEALMRADVTPFMSPLKILKYAEHLERLYDVERLTFFNVLDFVHDNQDVFQEKKVFINSIPGNRLIGEDEKLLETKMLAHSGSVVVELTEQTELADDELAAMKASYARMGIQTAVDDYGTGYSNVTNLLRYMPNYVKIDRMLLSEIQDSPQKQHFVREIVEFAHDNDIWALAEGVETSQELQMVIHLGVDLIQGYYTAKPSKEIIAEIPFEIKEEIVRYHQQELDDKRRKVYVAGKEGRISLAKLVADKYESIEVVSGETTYRDVTISGVPGMESDIWLNIKDGYQGRIVLDNVSFHGKKQNACVQIGEGCDVVLVLEGDNQFEDGGIRVPETSRLTLEGDGDLTIQVTSDDGFGIGNDLNSTHGILEFEQDGCIAIHGSGYQGVGIGSGKGGEILIQRGKYAIDFIGESGVGIGAHHGDVNIVVNACNMSLKMGTTNNVGIGSMTGNTKVSIKHILLRAISGGTVSVGIGSLTGENSVISIANANLNMNLRAQKLCALGLGVHSSILEVKESEVVIKGEGREAIAMGNYEGTGQLQIINTDVDSQLKTGMSYDIGAADSDICISNGRCLFMLNGAEIVRVTQEGEL
ncbi:MAG: EAL domain-containing protein [Lachnospiraceae bacterium]|nr:EAL domain-containing protein [Lachnospiraceae bacterium]